MINKKMLSVRKTKAETGISIESIDFPPPPNKHEVLIQVKAAGICGSDINIYQWGENYNFMTKYLPVVLGHEFSGVVCEVGSSVKHLSPGDLVVAMPSISCMRCELCFSGTPQMCPNKQTLGFTRNGAFSSHVLMPVNGCHKLPNNTDLDLAALIEPLCIGDNAADTAQVAAGDTVVVLGPGSIGQAIIHAAKWRGADRIIAIGKNDEARLNIARQMGATDLIDLANEESLEAAIRNTLSNTLADVVIEATGHPSSINDGLKILRPGGILVAAGIHKVSGHIDLTSLVRNKQQLRGAHGSTHKNWQRMIARVAKQPDLIRPMLSKTLDLKDAIKGFNLCLERQVSKVVLKP